MERTLAIIKPDACGKPWLEEVMVKDEEAEEPAFVPQKEVRAPDIADEIIKRIQSEGFTIVQKKIVRLTPHQAREFYQEHEGKPFVDRLVGFMSSGPCMALVLEKENAIADWRALMGPTNTFTAKEQAASANPLDDSQWCLRALFGSDQTRNAVHGSDSSFSANREIGFFFPPTNAPLERTVCLVKPDAVDNTDNIVSSLEASGFTVLHRKTETLTKERAEEFYAEHKGKSFFNDLIGFMTSGPTTALLLEGRKAIGKLRLALGPTSTDAAKEKAPKSLRARFGTDNTKNAVHGSDSAASAEREINFWFGALPHERTLALIKPGTARAHSQAIRNAMLEAGFTIIAERRVQLSREDAEDFYAEHKSQRFFDPLCTYMSSDYLLAFVLSKTAAIKYVTAFTNSSMYLFHSSLCLSISYWQELEVIDRTHQFTGGKERGTG